MADKKKRVLTEAEIAEKKKRRRLKIARGWFLTKKGILYICLTILALACLLPFLMMMVNATRDGREIVTGFTLIPGDAIANNWKTLSGTVDLFRAMLNSVIVAVPTTLLAAYFSSITAYGLAMYKFKGRGIIFSVTVLFMMIPGQLSLLGFFELVKKLNMIDTYWPLILPAIASAGTVFFLRQYIQSILSKELIEAARIDGAREIYTFHKIVLPIMAPGIATMSIGGFIGSWNNYLMPLILLTSTDKFTLPLMMTRLNESTDLAANQGAIYLGVAISVLPILIVFCFCSKYIIGSITAGSVKG